VACACGRIGFDPLGDAADVGYFVSPTGDDGNPGTRAAPWGTLPYAIGRLQPGDQLTLLDGDYDGHAPVGSLQIDCSTNAMNGTASAPITVHADHTRHAHVFDISSPLHVSHCAHWVIEDLWIEGLDDPNDTGSVARLYNNDHLSVRGLLAQHPNRYHNTDLIEVGMSTNTLVENCEGYDFHRSAFSAYLSSGSTFRGLYANGRGYPDLAGGYQSTCPGGDTGFDAYYDSGGTIEDVIVEGICADGFAVVAGRSSSGATGIGDDHQFVDTIAIGPGNNGYTVYSDCDASAPCDTPDRYAQTNTVTHAVAIDFSIGFELDGVENTLDHVSAFAATAGVGVKLDVATPLDGLQASATVVAALGVGGSGGVASTDQTVWKVDHANMFGSSTPYNPLDANVTVSTTIDPMLGGCEVYIPQASPMANAGPSGTTIGADIRTLSLAGAPTTNAFWGTNGVFAGCGVIVPGVNDDPSTACTGVHQRLNVGTNGCALP
jgi:hypothetical protein